MPPEVFSVTTLDQSVQPGRGNRAFRQPAWRSPSSTVRPSRTRSDHAQFADRALQRGASDREAASYILLVQLLPPPRQHDVAAIHHHDRLREFLGEIEILLHQQDGHSPRDRNSAITRPISLMMLG